VTNAHIVLALNRSLDIVVDFEVDKTLQTVALGETFDGAFPMLSNATNKIVRDADVQNSVRPVSQNVDVAPHRPMTASVDGRDKPGHDG
jgi:hypothetical protein